MASFHGHLSFSTMAGAAYGAAGIWFWDLDWGPAFLGAGITALGGLIPDLDSDSGIPLRELSSLCGAMAPCLLYSRLRHAEFSLEQTLVLLGGAYLLIRFVLASIIRRFTVHRGMFHSLPGMLATGLAVYLLYDSDPSKQHIRVYLAVAAMLGFLSHLVLDELYSVDFRGVAIRLNKYAGSALKLYSSSWKATATCYLLLCLLLAACMLEGQGAAIQQAILARIRG